MTKTTNILVVTTGIPEDVGGAPIRNYYVLKSLCNMPNTTVDLFSICVKERMAAKKKQLEDDLPVRTHLIPYKFGTLTTKVYAVFVARMQPHMVVYRHLAKLGNAVWDYCLQNKVDIIHIEQMDAYYCLAPYIENLKKRGIKIVLDEHNIEADVLRGTGLSMKFPLNIIAKTMVGSLRRLETNAVRSSDAVLACSEIDAIELRKINEDGHTYVIPNGVDCSQFTPGTHKTANSLLFIGSPGYPPNAEALDYYLSKVHPNIKALVPSIRLHIIGRNSKEWLKEKGFDGDKTILTHGFVPSIKPYLDRATIGICPVRSGSGTRLKVLTYMSAEIPVISTSKGAEGIGYTDGVNICIADTAADFATAVVDMLKNHKESRKIGKNSRLLMKSQYDWNIISKKIAASYAEISG